MTLLPTETVVLRNETDRRLGWRSLPTWVRRLSGPVILIALWQLLSWVGILKAQTLAPPSAVVSAGWDLTKTGVYPKDVLVSVERIIEGGFFGVLLGVALALITGLFRIGDDTLGSTMEVLRSVPVIGLMPLVIVWFGIGEAPKIAILTLGVAFPIYVNTYAGIRGVDNRLIETGRTFGLNRVGLVRRVILPGAVPSFLTGLRVGLVAAVLYLVYVEQINASSGIGYLMNQATTWNETNIIVLCLATYGILGLLADALVRLLERRLLVWRRSFSGT
jgi:sulfonate transport system permease protein